MCEFLFFFNDTATTEIYTLSLHDALPIYRERGQLLVLLGERAVGEHLLADLAERAIDLHRRLQHQAVEPLLLRVALVDVHQEPPGYEAFVSSSPRASAIARSAKSSRTTHCWTSSASCVNGSASHSRAHSWFSAAKPRVGESFCSRISRSSCGSPAARSRSTTAARTAAFQMPVSPSSSAA